MYLSFSLSLSFPFFESNTIIYGGRLIWSPKYHFCILNWLFNKLVCDYWIIRLWQKPGVVKTVKISKKETKVSKDFAGSKKRDNKNIYIHKIIWIRFQRIFIPCSPFSRKSLVEFHLNSICLRKNAPISFFVFFFSLQAVQWHKTMKWNHRWILFEGGNNNIYQFSDSNKFSISSVMFLFVFSCVWGLWQAGVCFEKHQVLFAKALEKISGYFFESFFSVSAVE